MDLKINYTITENHVQKFCFKQKNWPAAKMWLDLS